MTKEENQYNKNDVDSTLEYLDRYSEIIIRAAQEVENYLAAKEKSTTVKGSDLIDLNTSIARVFDTIAEISEFISD